MRRLGADKCESFWGGVCLCEFQFVAKQGFLEVNGSGGIGHPGDCKDIGKLEMYCCSAVTVYRFYNFSPVFLFCVYYIGVGLKIK